MGNNKYDDYVAGICEWIFYTDYYETDCSQTMEEEDYVRTEPTYCPYCGNKIRIENKEDE